MCCCLGYVSALSPCFASLSFESPSPSGLWSPSHPSTFMCPPQCHETVIHTLSPEYVSKPVPPSPLYLAANFTDLRHFNYSLVCHSCCHLILSIRLGHWHWKLFSKDKNPDIKHPCFTPDLILNQSDILHPSITVHSNPSYLPTTTVSILRGTPWLPGMFHKLFL